MVKKRDSLTTINPLPDPLVKWGKCLLLHDKTSFFHNGKIIYICKVCDRVSEYNG